MGPLREHIKIEAKRIFNDARNPSRKAKASRDGELGGWGRDKVRGPHFSSAINRDPHGQVCPSLFFVFPVLLKFSGIWERVAKEKGRESGENISVGRPVVPPQCLSVHALWLLASRNQDGGVPRSRILALVFPRNKIWTC